MTERSIVIVIEDDAELLGTLKEYLTAGGYFVEASSDARHVGLLIGLLPGVVAVICGEKLKFSLKQGHTVWEENRGQLAEKRIAFILTADDSDRAVVRAEDIATPGFVLLRKPFSPHELHDVLVALLARFRGPS